MPEASLCRVSVHADGVNVDLALPATVAVATLIPSIVDVLATAGSPGDRSGAVRYRLSRVGGPALAASKTLAQQHIRDGTALVLTRSAVELPPPRFDDAAEAVSRTLDGVAPSSTRQAARLTGALTAGWLATMGDVVLIRTVSINDARHSAGAAGVAGIVSCAALFATAVSHRVYGDRIAAMTLGLLATGFAAVAGLLAVPGGPAAPNMLLATMAAAVTSTLALRVTGCGAVTFTATACCAIVAAATALAGIVTAAPLHTLVLAPTVASLGLLEFSARLSVTLAGLSPRLGTDDAATPPSLDPDLLSAKAIRADEWLTTLVASWSVAAATGAAIEATSAGIPRTARIAFAAATAAVLLLRARAEVHLVRRVVLTVTGTAALTAGFVAAAAVAPGLPWILGAAALLAAAALCLGFVAPAVTWSPTARRGIDLLGYLALAAIVPLACWLGGLYGAVRGLSLP
ncbi:type VII secretion integral membrane protein EccD [Mycobacterium noviomagense]|uniref:type VII secretion integral membrane protein EccD n=1 Tax=Mycobacterium noviomagense TaxID=459858 RepID=UPI001E379542|nr:type VII secretion integral membrane protein EccD [Mycobacterium noviomagense]